MELGAQAAPFLEEASQSDPDSKVRVEARGVLERIRMDTIRREWEQEAALPDERLDLEKGAFLLAKIRYPDLDIQPYHQRLDELAERVRPKLKGLTQPQEHLSAINQVLFEGEGFHGNWDDYFDPENSYLNRVLDRKLGIPISLSVLYLLTAQRLKVPVHGVGIPGHFMIKYQDDQQEFYIDAFNRGRFLSRPQCIQFIVEAGYPYQPEFMQAVGVRDVLARMLRNLILIYVDRHEQTLERIMTRFLDVLYADKPGDPQQEVDLD